MTKIEAPALELDHVLQVVPFTTRVGSGRRSGRKEEPAAVAAGVGVNAGLDLVRCHRCARVVSSTYQASTRHEHPSRDLHRETHWLPPAIDSQRALSVTEQRSTLRPEHCQRGCKLRRLTSERRRATARE